MSKITVHFEEESIYVLFPEYYDERQLKDFYKLYKKASGNVVIEYTEEKGTVVAKTNSSTSVYIGRNEKLGCFIVGTKADKQELIENVYWMLCYRYTQFKEYEEVINNIGKMKHEELVERIKEITKENDIEREYEDDIEVLININKIA